MRRVEHMSEEPRTHTLIADDWEALIVATLHAFGRQSKRSVAEDPDSAEALETRATLDAIGVVIDREAAALAKLEEQISSLHRNVDQSATEAVAWAEQARQRMAEYRKAGE